jgi:hypothetical protein
MPSRLASRWVDPALGFAVSDIVVLTYCLPDIFQVGWVRHLGARSEYG